MHHFFRQEVDCHVLHGYSTSGFRKRDLVIAMLCATCILQFAGEARVHCSARDVLQNQLKLKKTHSVERREFCSDRSPMSPCGRRLRQGPLQVHSVSVARGRDGCQITSNCRSQD